MSRGAGWVVRGAGEELRHQLTDARVLCQALGLMSGYRAVRQGRRGLTIRCPVHAERTPSCSVTVGRDGTLRCKCFGCGWTGDALSLIAAVHQLDVRHDFAQVLELAARIAGTQVREARGRRREEAYEAPTFPERSEVERLWGEGVGVGSDQAAAVYLRGRAIEVGGVEREDLARVLREGAWTPGWATSRGRSWSRSHRLLLPVVDYRGQVRSLRAWRLPGDEGPEDAPKRTAPAGKATAGLVLACPVARKLLRGEVAPLTLREPLDVVVVEGEPDFLTWASRVSEPGRVAVVGLLSGSWTEALAGALPVGVRVVIRTHEDAAGDRYAREIVESLRGRGLTVLDRRRPMRGARGTKPLDDNDRAQLGELGDYLEGVREVNQGHLVGAEEATRRLREGLRSEEGLAVVRCTAGTGKSYEVRLLAVERQQRGEGTIFVVPTHRLGEQVQQELKGLGVRAQRPVGVGRVRLPVVGGAGEATVCVHPEATDLLSRAGGRVREQMCKACPARDRHPRGGPCPAYGAGKEASALVIHQQPLLGTLLRHHAWLFVATEGTVEEAAACAPATSPVEPGKGARDGDPKKRGARMKRSPKRRASREKTRASGGAEPREQAASLFVIDELPPLTVRTRLEGAKRRYQRSRLGGELRTEVREALEPLLMALLEGVERGAGEGATVRAMLERSGRDRGTVESLLEGARALGGQEMLWQGNLPLRLAQQSMNEATREHALGRLREVAEWTGVLKALIEAAYAPDAPSLHVEQGEATLVTRADWTRHIVSYVAAGGQVRILDATAPLEALKLLLGEQLEVHQIDVQDAPGVKRRALVWGHGARGRHTFRGRVIDEELRGPLRRMAQALQESEARQVGILAHQPVADALRAWSKQRAEAPGQPAPAWAPEELVELVEGGVELVVGHYGAQRGLDTWKECDALVTLGDPWPNLGAARAEARCLGLDPEAWVLELARAELVQAWGRVRSVHRTTPVLVLHLGGESLLPNATWAPQWAGVEPERAERGRPRTVPTPSDPVTWPQERQELKLTAHQHAQSLGMTYGTYRQRLREVIQHLEPERKTPEACEASDPRSEGERNPEPGSLGWALSSSAPDCPEPEEASGSACACSKTSVGCAYEREPRGGYPPQGDPRGVEEEEGGRFR